MKRQVHLLEGVEVAAADTRHPRGGVEVEEQGEVRSDAARGEGVEIANRLEVHAPAPALVGQGRVGVAVRDDDGAALERRPDDLGHVLLARRHEEERLCQRRRRSGLLLEEPADGGAQTGAVRLAGQNHFEAAGMKPLAEPLALGGLS